MNKICAIAVVLGCALTGSALYAQAGSGQEAVPSEQKSVAVVPADQQPSPEQLAKLFQVMRLKEQMASVTNMMPGLMRQQFGQQFEQMKQDNPAFAAITPEQQQAMKNVMVKFMEKSMTLYPPDEMISDMTNLYRKYITKSDVDGVIAFYSSPAGQHMLDATPVITREFMPTVMQKTQERMRPLVMEMSKEMAEVAKAPAGESKQK